MRHFRYLLIITTLALPLGLTMAGEDQADDTRSGTTPAAPEAQEGDRSDGDGEEVLRFTNESLKPVRPQDRHDDVDDDDSTRTDGDGSEDDEGGESLDEALEDISAEALKESMDETRHEIARLQLHLEYLNKRLLSVQNPILRGVTPSTSEEEEAVGGLSNPERLAWVKDQIAVTEDELAEAQEHMSTLMRR
jgi:uncharacterized coiled-coil protein SlyX